MPGLQSISGMKGTVVMLRYKGGGWLAGVPSRDLSEEEATKFGVARLISSGLYERVEEDLEIEPPVVAEKRGVKQHGNRN